MTKGVFATQGEWSQIFGECDHFVETDRTLRNARDYLYRADDKWKATSLEGLQQAFFTGSQEQWEVRKALSELLGSASDGVNSYISSTKSEFERMMLLIQFANFLEYYNLEVGDVDASVDTAGAISLLYDGMLNELKTQMENAVTPTEAGASRVSGIRIYNRVKGGNTDAFMNLYGTIDNRETTESMVTVKLFKDTAQLSQVMSAVQSTSNPCTGLVLAAVNSSGLSGIMNFSMPDGSLPGLSNTYSLNLVTQSVLENNTSIGSVECGPQNTGVVTIDGLVVYENVANNNGAVNANDNYHDVINVRCTTNTLGSERFTVTGKYNEASYPARFGAQFRSHLLGTAFTINRHITSEAGAGSMTITSFDFTGLNSTTCPDGKFYNTISSAGTYLTLYSDSLRTTAIAVGDCTAASGTVTLTAANDSGLTGTLVYTSRSAGNFEIHLHPVAENDEWFYTVENSYDGIIQSFFCRLYNIPLPSRATGDETITDPAFAPITAPP